MSDDPEAKARGLLTELEEVLAAKDLDQMADLFTHDAVLIGDAIENFDREAIVAYLDLMANMTPTVRWRWDQVAAVFSGPGALSFAAAGTIAFHDQAGLMMSGPERFRLTGLAVDDGDRWRWRHFHGSEPQAD
jgi:uncharacterized protein (TIGR02246 family)